MTVAPPLGSAAGDLYGSVIVCDFPSSHWRLSNATPLADSVGANTLTAVGTPTNATRLISVGEARDFNGSSGAYTATDHATLDLGDTYSLETWFKPDSVTGTHTLISKGSNGYQLRTNGTAIELLQEGVGVIVATTGLTLVIGTTYHVVAAKDGASSAKLIVNGVDRSGTVTDRTCANTSTQLNIARKSDGTDWFDGVLDEVAVYPYAITASMALAHYEAGSGSLGILPYPNAPLPQVKVEIAFTTAWNATYPTWEDVTADVRFAPGFKIQQSGRTDETQRSSPGSASLSLSNRERKYDPTYTGGPHGSKVVPMRAIRIRAAYGGQHYWLFRGWVVAWPPSYVDYGKDALTELDCIDFLSAFAAAQIPDGTSFPSELADLRIGRCLDLLGVPASARNIDTGRSTMPGDENPSGSILDHIQSVAASDGGFFYAGADGRATYEGRLYRAVTETASRATFGDAGSPELIYADIEQTRDDAFLFNHVEIAPGNEIPVVDVPASPIPQPQYFNLTEAAETDTAIGLVYGLTPGPGPGPGPIALGVYCGNDAITGVGNFQTFVGSTVNIAVDWTAWSTWADIEGPGWLLDPWAASPYQLLLGVVPWPANLGGGGGGASWAIIASGSFNTHYATLANNLLSRGMTDTIIRPASEFGGYWNSYYPTNATDFVNGWRQIVNTMRGIIPTLKFSWNIYPSHQTIPMSSLYPGDAYVDYVSFSLYDENWNLGLTTPLARWNDWLTKPTGGNDIVAFAAAHSKPLGIDEWGLSSRLDGTNQVGGLDSPSFVQYVYDWIHAHPFAYQCYFNFNEGTTAGLHEINPSNQFPTGKVRYQSLF